MITLGAGGVFRVGFAQGGACLLFWRDDYVPFAWCLAFRAAVDCLLLSLVVDRWSCRSLRHCETWA